MARPLAECPICGSGLRVTELSCSECSTVIRNAFEPCRFCALSRDHAALLESFLRSRGNVSSMASEMGVSFPTAARRLDGLLEALGLRGADLVRSTPRSRPEQDRCRREILEQLDRGDITAEEATRRIRDI